MSRNEPGQRIEGWQDPEAGFTLVETLTVLGVLSILLFLIVESYTRTFTLFARSGQDYRVTRALIELTDDLGADLGSALSVPAQAADPVLQLRSPSSGRRRNPAEGREVFELSYRLQAGNKAMPGRKRLVREVRLEGSDAVVERREYDLDLARIEIRDPGLQPPRRATEVSLEYFLGPRARGTGTASFLVESLAWGGGTP